MSSRDLRKALQDQGVHVPPNYQPPKPRPPLRGPRGTYDAFPIEVRKVDDPFPTIPPLPFAWLTEVQREHPIWTSDRPWAAVDVVCYAPPSSLQVVVRVYGIVGDTRTLMASGRINTHNVNVLGRPEWVAAAAAHVERWEVTAQVFAYAFKPGLSVEHLRYAVIAYGKEPAGDRTALGGISKSIVPTFAAAPPGPTDEDLVSQGLIAKDRVRLVFMKAYNHGADTFLLLFDNDTAPTAGGVPVESFFIPAGGMVSFTPPSLSESYFETGLVWRAWTGPTGLGPFAGVYDAAAVLFPTFYVR